LIIDAIKDEPMTCLLLAIYSVNIVWQLTQGRYGPAFYWFAAAQITFTVTWLMGRP